MPLYAAAYVSTPTVAFSDRDLTDLLLAARRFNAAHGITGKLIVAEADHGRGPEAVRFVQWIEGDLAEVRQCMRRIQADGRHTEIEVQFFAPVERRRFPTWDMAFEAVPLTRYLDTLHAVVPEPDAVPLSVFHDDPG